MKEWISDQACWLGLIVKALTNTVKVIHFLMEYGESGPATLAKISEMMFNLLHQSQDRLQMQFEEERSRHVLLIEEQKKQLDMQELVIKEMEV